MDFQQKTWSTDFGKEYTDRNIMNPEELDNLYKNKYGVTRTEMNERFLSSVLSKEAKILEIGCNVGNQLRLLQIMGFKNLYGIELQPYAVQKAKDLTKEINIIQGEADDLPFKDEYFDLVFTSGVLIHIAPDNVVHVIKEINRCTKKYIWGFEYFSENFTEVNYRENSNLLWKGEYANEYIKCCTDLKLLKEQKYKYCDSLNIDSMFLLVK